jgi:hypothetical protein
LVSGKKKVKNEIMNKHKRQGKIKYEFINKASVYMQHNLALSLYWSLMHGIHTAQYFSFIMWTSENEVFGSLDSPLFAGVTVPAYNSHLHVGIRCVLQGPL